MSAMTNFLETTILNTMRGQAATAPAGVYVALFLSNPGESGTGGTEVGYSGYARQAVSFGAPVEDGAATKISNTAEIVFPTPMGAGGVATHAAIMSAATGGNALAYRELTNPVTLANEVSPRFFVGEIVLSISGGNLDPAFKAKILNYFRGTSIAGFSPYLAMYDGDPASGGAELAGAGYARLPLTLSAPAEQPNGQALSMNTNSAQSAPANVNWGGWAYGVIMDALTGGDRVWVKQNAGVYVMTNGARADIQSGQISVALN